MRNQCHAKNVLGVHLRILASAGHFYAAAFTAAAGVNLRLHYHAAGALGKQLAGYFGGFFQRVGHLALGHGNAVLRKDFLCLILMNLQFWCPSHRKSAAKAWISDSVWCPAVPLASSA